MENKKKWIRIFKIFLLIYVLIGFGLYILQDRILFHPVSLKKNHNYDFKENHKEINIPLTDESNLNIVQFLSTDTVTRGVVLYFHGNKKNIAWYEQYPPYFTKHGYEVWMIDYPGYGKSTGKLSEEILYAWALKMYKFSRSRFSTDSIIIYGKSMGTGIASQLASVRDCKRLIMETPYYSIRSLFSKYTPMYPVSMMLKYELPTYRFLEKVTAPVSFFHGTNDWIIPYSNAVRLKEKLKPIDEFVTIKGGSHNNLYDYSLMTGKLDSLLKS
jgi:uncharacterized protein